jgi:amino acid transporter
MGVITGAAMVVVAYNGFETTVSLSAEAKNSKRDVPLAVALSFAISTTIYVSVTLAIVYLVPWYSLDESTGMPSSLEANGLTVPKYIIIGAILLAGSSIALCSLTTLARGLMVFSKDGLIFDWLSSVADCSVVPVAATITASAVTIVFTIVFSFQILIQMVSGGALLTFTAVCYTLIVISYTKTKEVVDESSGLVQSEVFPRDNQSLTTSEGQEIPGYIHNQEWKIVGWMATFCTISSICVVFIYWPSSWSFWRVRLPIMMALAFINLLILSYIKLIYHIQPQRDPGFVCPGIPFVPATGIALNLALFSALNAAAHFMCFAYIVIGILLYFTYGYFHSTITLTKRKELNLSSESETEERINH